MADDKPVSLLLDAIAAATTAKAHQEADIEAAEAGKRAAQAVEDEDESLDEPWDADAERPKRPAWLGRSAAELLQGREGRINSTNDVHTGGAKVVDED